MVKSFVHEKLKLFLASNKRDGIATQVGFICRDTEDLEWAYAHPLLYCEGLFSFRNISCSLDYANGHVLFHIRFDKDEADYHKHVGVMIETRKAFLEDKSDDSSYNWSFAIIDDATGCLYALDLLSIDMFPMMKGALVKCALKFEDQSV